MGGFRQHWAGDWASPRRPSKGRARFRSWAHGFKSRRWKARTADPSRATLLSCRWLTMASVVHQVRPPPLPTCDNRKFPPDSLKEPQRQPLSRRRLLTCCHVRWLALLPSIYCGQPIPGPPGAQRWLASCGPSRWFALRSLACAVPEYEPPAGRFPWALFPPSPIPSTAPGTCQRGECPYEMGPQTQGCLLCPKSRRKSHYLRLARRQVVWVSSPSKKAPRACINFFISLGV